MAFRRQVKNFVKNYSEAEIKVREATSNDPWGPSSSLMLAISDMTFNAVSLSEIMHMLWQRLGDHGRNWRHVYKSLALMDYLIKNGSKKVSLCCREGLCNLQMLKDFQHVDEAGKDQGRYIRERSKQIITLLMDEQLLFKEREVASWTRQRISYSMTFPNRLPAAGNSPAACASVLIPESLTSEKKHSLLTIASLRNKKNTSKARLRLEQCQDIPSPAGPSLAKDSHPLRMKKWKSTEDLTLLHDECPKQLLPAIPPSITSPTSWLSEGEAEVCNLWDADAVSTPSEKRPSMQTNMSLGKRLEKTITNAPTESAPQTPQEKQTALKSFETLTPIQAFRPSVSTASEVASSFSTLSASSPDLARPEKSAHHSPLVLTSPSFWSQPHPQSPSAPFAYKDEAARVHHPFASRDPASSDDEEYPSLPNNSYSAEKPDHIPRSNQVAFSTPTRAYLPSVSQAIFQTSGGLSRESESTSIHTLLGEVRGAVLRLHEDLSLVIQELGVINSHLGNLSVSSQAASNTSQDPQSSRGSSDP
nr:ENTH domain-containing protein 1 isoform X2 [Peromyscus maniculatus bairdii]